MTSRFGGATGGLVLADVSLSSHPSSDATMHTFRTKGEGAA